MKDERSEIPSCNADRLGRLLLIPDVMGSKHGGAQNFNSNDLRPPTSGVGLTFAVARAWYSGQPFTVMVSCMYWYTWKET